MGGIAIVIQGADFSSKRIGRITPSQGVDIAGLEIVHESSYTGISAQLGVKYAPSYTSQKGVTWSITDGSSYASINSSTGLVTILENASGMVTVRVTSTANQSIYADASFMVTYDSTPVYATGLTISLGTPVRNKMQASVAYTPASTNQYGVTWAITQGSAYASIDSSTGLIQIKEGADYDDIEVTATYTHDNTVTASITESVTFEEIVLPADAQTYWNTFKTSASGYQNWFYGGESETKAVFLDHYEKMGNSVPIGEVFVHNGTSSAYAKENGTVASIGYGVRDSKTYYDSVAGAVVAVPKAYVMQPSGTGFSKLLVIADYETPADAPTDTAETWIVAGGNFGSTAKGQVHLRPTQIDIFYGTSNAKGVHLPNSAVTGTDTLVFRELYIEFDLENQNNAGYVKRIVIDGVDYTSSLEEGGSSYKGTVSGKVRPAVSDMLVLIAE